MTQKNIHQHISDDMEILDNPTISPQQRRHIEQELDSLEKYRDNHPNEEHDPTSLELYCDSHPDASECRIYED